jgi:hypothetical protein
MAEEFVRVSVDLRMMPSGKGETGELRAAGGVAIEDVEGDTFDHGLTITTDRPHDANRVSFVLNPDLTEWPSSYAIPLGNYTQKWT